MCSIRAVRHAWCTQWCNRHNDHVSLLRLWGAWENCCSTKMLDMQKLEKLCEKLKLQNDCNRALETKPKTYDPKVLTNLPRPSMQHPLFYLRFPFVHALGLLDSWMRWVRTVRIHSKITFKDVQIFENHCFNKRSGSRCSQTQSTQICSNGEGFQLAEEKEMVTESSWVELSRAESNSPIHPI